MPTATAKLSAVKNQVAAVFRIEHPATPEMVSELLEQLSEWLIDRPDLRQMFARWIRATLILFCCKFEPGPFVRVHPLASNDESINTRWLMHCRRNLAAN
jgi:hypothetical protein